MIMYFGCGVFSVVMQKEIMILLVLIPSVVACMAGCVYIAKCIFFCCGFFFRVQSTSKVDVIFNDGLVSELYLFCCRQQRALEVVVAHLWNRITVASVVGTGLL